MSADSLIADLSRQDVRLWIQDDQLHFDGPEGAITDDVLSKLLRNKPEILKHLAETSNPLEFCLRVHCILDHCIYRRILNSDPRQQTRY